MHHTLVPSDRVEHANVYGRDGAKLGTIERLMLDKVSGTVAYAVIKTGGVLASHHHYPVRWDALRFDSERQAFVVELTLEDLRAGPSEFDEDDFDWGDRSRPIRTRIIGRCRQLAEGPPLGVDTQTKKPRKTGAPFAGGCPSPTGSGQPRWWLI